MSLEDAYQAFLTFHDVVDGALALDGNYEEIRDAFVLSEEKMLGERGLKREIKDWKVNYGFRYAQYWVKERQHKKGETNE